MDPEELQKLTCARRNIKDCTLDENLPEASPPRARPPPLQDVGALDLLPVELLHATLLHLDLRSLMHFRYVNRRAAELVDALPQYRVLARFAGDVIRGILCAQTGAWITCELLYQKLITAECEECGDFAGYLYIITCRRVCFICNREKKRYLPIGRSLARRRYGLESHELDRIPRVKTLPGIYSPGKSKHPHSTVLYDFDSVIRAAVSRHGSEAAVTRYVDKIQTRLDRQLDLRREKAQAEGGDPGRIRSSPKLFPWDSKGSNPHRFVAFMSVPCLVPDTGELDRGFYCQACTSFNGPPHPWYWRRKFNLRTFSEHMTMYSRISNGRHTQ